MLCLGGGNFFIVKKLVYIAIEICLLVNWLVFTKQENLILLRIGFIVIVLTYFYNQVALSSSLHLKLNVTLYVLCNDMHVKLIVAFLYNFADQTV